MYAEILNNEPYTGKALHLKLTTQEDHLVKIYGVLTDVLGKDILNHLKNLYQCSLCHYCSFEACNVHQHLMTSHSTVYLTERLYIRIFGQPHLVRKIKFRILAANKLWLNVKLKCLGNILYYNILYTTNILFLISNNSCFSLYLSCCCMCPVKQ